MSKITLLGVGDNIPCREDYDTLYEHVAPILQKADITFGQVETVMIDKSITDLVPYIQSSTRGCGCSSDPGVATAMKKAGYDVVSFSSNHAMDYGRLHFLNTIDYLRKAGLEVIGVGENEEDARRITYIKRGDTTIAFLGYCSILPQGYWAQEARPGMNPARGFTIYEQIEHDQPGTACRIHSFANEKDKAKMLEDIKIAKENADIVVMSIHWGIHFKKAEIAQYQVEYAHAAIDAGVDLILGHHAHILKPIEVYKGKVIFYSLGNFAMEDISNMKRDIATYKGDFFNSSNHKEIENVRPGTFGTAEAHRTFPEDSYYTMIAKIEIEDKAIQKVSYLPANIPEDFAPYVVAPEDPLYNKINAYMEEISEMEGIKTEYIPNGEEVLIKAKE